MSYDIVMDINGRHSDPIHADAYWRDWLYDGFTLLVDAVGEVDRAASFEVTPRAAQEKQPLQEGS